MFNPDPPIQVEAFASRPVVVVDDVLTDPNLLRGMAAKHWDAFAVAGHNAFPGPELALPDSAVQAFMLALHAHAADSLGLRSVISAHARLSVVTRQPAQLSPLQRMCHRDRLQSSPDQIVVAGVLYLFDDVRLGGTNFFEPLLAPAAIDAHMQACSGMSTPQYEALSHAPASYMLTSNAWFAHVGTALPRQNRMIWYEGSRFHGSHIEQPSLLVADPLLGRLTLNVFAVCERF